MNRPNIAMLPSPLRGIIPPMLTPLQDAETLDASGLERLVDHLFTGGVHGLFLLGTTGEGPSLSYRVRQELIERVCEQVSGQVPVLVCVSDTSLVESLNLADFAADAGAQAVVLTAPYYFPTSQADLIHYCTQAIERMPLPTFLYNMPSHSKLNFDIPTLQELFNFPKVAGLKDSSGNMTYWHEARQLIEKRADLSLLIGPEQLLGDTVLMGGHGGVSGGANLFPRLYVDLYQAAVEERLDDVRMLQARVMQVSSTIYQTVSGGAAIIGGLKAALAHLGICQSALSEVFAPITDQQMAKIQQHLAQLDWQSVPNPS